MNTPNPASHQIFVSYSRHDADWAGAFVDTLSKQGWSVFVDIRTIRAGDEWSPEIDAAIDAAKVVIGVWSKHSVRSSYVIAEAARAVVRGTLIPLSIDRTPAPPAFRRFHVQPMHVTGATTLPSGLVSTIEARIAEAAPPVPSSAEEQRLREEVARSAAMARESGVPLLALQTQLERLGEVDVEPQDMPARLEGFVSEFLKLKADLSRPTNAGSDVASTQARALDLLNDGDLDGARVLIDAALAQQREHYRQAAREMATLLADRARIDTIQVRYPEAIAGYEEACSLISFESEGRLSHLESLIDVLIRQGDEFGDNVALTRAVDVIRTRAMQIVSRTLTPVDWARLQVWLGNAQSMLGEREAGTERLREAVVAYRAALEEYTRDSEPLNWAATQTNLGTALARLGERESGTLRLEEAVTAYRAALNEYARDRAPLRWAMTQNNLGNALATLGERESGTLRLQEAVKAYQAALEEHTRERAPLSWAMTQINLGDTLRTLGERESGTTRLEEALAACRLALEEYTQDRAPLHWAMTQDNLGSVLLALGMRESGTAHLEEAVTAFRAALKQRTRSRVPLLWAETQYKLGNALQALGAHEIGTAWLEEAVTAFRAALQEYTRDHVPLHWVAAEKKLDEILAIIASRRPH